MEEIIKFGDEDGSAFFLEAQMDFEEKEVWFYTGEIETCDRDGMALNLDELDHLIAFLNDFMSEARKNG